MGNSANFRNSDCVTARVNYVESVDSDMWGKGAVSNFGTSFLDAIKSICVYRSAFMLSGKFHARTFRTPTRSCFFRSKENHRGKCACEVFSIE